MTGSSDSLGGKNNLKIDNHFLSLSLALGLGTPSGFCGER